MGPQNRYRILYFASLKDITGVPQEERFSTALTCRALFDELKKVYHFDLPQECIKIAVNDTLVDSWDTPLKTGDTIAFLPPVAGG